MIGVAVMFFAKFCPPQGPWPLPPWCKEYSGTIPLPSNIGNVDGSDLLSVDDGDFEYYSSDQINNVFNAPVIAISPNMISNPQDVHSDGIAWFAISQDAGSKLIINRFHKDGLHVWGASMTIRHLNESKADPKPEMAALDINGNPIPLQKPGMPVFLPGEYFYSIFNPQWQQLLIDQAKAYIDMGAEGISMDEPATYGALIYEGGGSFDEYSMAAFREYLAGKYNADELSALFGISDITTFNFREYLIENHMQNTWNTSQQQPPLITYEFILCQNAGAADFLQRFSTEMKEYADTKYGRQFVLGINAAPQYYSSRMIPIGFLDYLIGEQFYFSNGYQRAFLSRKMLDGEFDNPIFYLSEVGLDTGNIPRQTTNLFKYIFADIYSNPGAGLILTKDGYYTMKGGTYLSQDKTILLDPDAANQYIDFMKANESLFELDEPAQVAVIISVPSIYSYYLPASESLWGSNETFTVMEILYDNRIPFNTVTSSNGIWSDSHLTLEKLKPYKVIVLPNTDLIDDEEISVLLDYVKQGGTVVQVNNFAQFNTNGERVNRPQLNTLKNTGVHQLDAGSWHNLGWLEHLGEYSWNENENRQVQPQEQTFNNPDAQAIRDTILKYSDQLISSTAPLTVNMRRFTDDGRVVLHLLNVNFDQTSDTFIQPENFSITVSVGDLKIASVKLYDFETGEVTQLAFSQEGDLITFEISDLFAYSIVECSEQ
jgi:hypothetical protein